MSYNQLQMITKEMYSYVINMKIKLWEWITRKTENSDMIIYDWSFKKRFCTWYLRIENYEQRIGGSTIRIYSTFQNKHHNNMDNYLAWECRGNAMDHLVTRGDEEKRINIQ